MESSLLDALRFSVSSPTDTPSEMQRSSVCVARSVSRPYNKTCTGCAPVFQSVTGLSIRRAQFQTDIQAEKVTVGWVAPHRAMSFYNQGARDTRKTQLELPPGLVRLLNTLRRLALTSAACWACWRHSSSSAS